MLDINLAQNLSKDDIIYLENLEVAMEKIIIKCDDEFLGYSITFAYSILEMLKINFTGIHPLFANKENQLKNEEK